jgi:hypothetical protein
MRIDVDLQSISINRYEFEHACPLSSFEGVLGLPSRTYCGNPPFGHRNNQIYYFDESGLYLIEHHATFLISSIAIVFVPDAAPFCPFRPFTGQLVVGNMEIRSGMGPRDFPANCSISFRTHLGYSLVADGERISIDISTVALRTKSGRKSRQRQISYVSIGFRDAHRSQHEVIN